MQNYKMSAPTRLFVGNLPYNVNEVDLRTAFSVYGEIKAVDIKTKPAAENDKKLFAFVSITASNYDIESCIQNFTSKDFNGNRLYVTRARESFLERLQREREQAQIKETNESEIVNFTPKPLNINLNSQKRKFESNVRQEYINDKKPRKISERELENVSLKIKIEDSVHDNTKKYCFDNKNIEKDNKKQNSDKKRLESMKKKREEFNQRKLIIKSGLTGIDDKATNKKVIFSDDEKQTPQENLTQKENGWVRDENKIKKLFEDGDSDNEEVNFGIKKQYEGKKGKKVLELQSRYKADKRFVLDERFIEDDKSDVETDQLEFEGVELGQMDEKNRQLNILQDVLGVPIKMKQSQDATKQAKSKLGMLRFDPTLPDHTKFLATVLTSQVPPKKSKKKKSKDTIEDEVIQEEPKEIQKVEVSKEQFYKVSETLKEALEQPNTFSLRSLFSKENNADAHEEVPEHNYENNLQQRVKEKKVKNPLYPGEKNPFVYDSSESDSEEDNSTRKEVAPQITDLKPVWREKLFFTESDNRLTDGLLFFTQSSKGKVHKDRRELKTVMKKRVYNKERKNQMFQKKIGGRRKAVKKNFRKRN